MDTIKITMKTTLYHYLPILFLLLVSCGSPKQSNVNEKAQNDLIKLSDEQIKSLGIQLGQLQTDNISLSVYANGMIEVPPQNKSFISFPFGGYIRRIEVLDGMKVSKGQLLMEVEHPDIIALQQEYLEILGQMEFLSADYERQKGLFEKEAGSAKNYQQAKSILAVNKAKLAGLELKLEMANVSLKRLQNGQIERVQRVVSPFNGVITKINASVGAFAEPKDNLMEIIDLKHAHAELTVYEKYLPYLRKDQQVSLQFVDASTKTNAKIFLIGSEISKERTIKVHCHFEDLPKDIVPGSYLKAEIATQGQKFTIVPEEAVVQRNGKDLLFIASGAGFRPIEIEVLMSAQGKVAIGSKSLHLLKKSKVVVKGAYDLLAILSKEIE